MDIDILIILVVCIILYYTFIYKSGKIEKFSTPYLGGTAYSFEPAFETNNSKWMKNVPDHALLSEMSIPGTHDSMTYTLPNAHIIAKTQSMNLVSQLTSGIRFIDARCKIDKNEFQMYHGFVPLGIWFGTVLENIIGFLQSNPSETIILSVQKESTDDDAQFENMFLKYWNYYNAHFYKYAKYNSNPTLKELRGKIIIYQNFASRTTYGINPGYSETQNHYNLQSNYELPYKLQLVFDHLHNANNGNKKTLYVNYLTASGGVLPYFVSSGKSSPETYASSLLNNKTGKDFSGTNVMTNIWLASGQFKRTGIIIMDFPGSALIGRIILANANIGSVCGVNSENSIYCTNNAMDVNQLFKPVPGKLKDISISGNMAYGVGTDGTVYYTYNISNPHWIKANGTLKQISFDGETVCGVKDDGRIFCARDAKYGNPVWVELPGKLSNISVSNGKLYGVNENGDIFYSPLDNTSWKKIDGNLKQITFDDDSVCGVSFNGDIHCSGNAKSGNISGWRKLDGNLSSVSLSKNRLYGVNSIGDIYLKKDISNNENWIKAFGKLQSVSFNK